MDWSASEFKRSSAESESEGQRQEVPPAKGGNLMCEEPGVERERGSGVNRDFFFSIAFVTCFWYHGNRNGHSTSLGGKANGMTQSSRKHCVSQR